MLTRIAAALGSRTSVRIHGRVQYLARAERVPSDYLSLTGCIQQKRSPQPAHPTAQQQEQLAPARASLLFYFFLLLLFIFLLCP